MSDFPTANKMSRHKINRNFFKSYSLFALLWTLLTVFWGVWVRLSLSGDGCGKSWPLCHQKLLPESAPAFIEWAHRAMSGFAALFILALWALALKIYPKKHIVRKLAGAGLILILVEALIGAFLVLSGFVGLNTSAARAGILALHLISSLALAGALSLCWRMSLWESFKIQKPAIYFVLAFPLLALTGNIASLAGQLFPALSLSQALALDFLPSAHISLKIRPFHPLLAILFVLALGWLSFLKKSLIPLALASLAVALFGFATLISLSPLWMKIGHLILAYSLWIFFVCSTAKPDSRRA